MVGFVCTIYILPSLRRNENGLFRYDHSLVCIPFKPLHKVVYLYFYQIEGVGDQRTVKLIEFGKSFFSLYIYGSCMI